MTYKYRSTIYTLSEKITYAPYTYSRTLHHSIFDFWGSVPHWGHTTQAPFPSAPPTPWSSRFRRLMHLPTANRGPAGLHLLQRSRFCSCHMQYLPYTCMTACQIRNGYPFQRLLRRLINIIYKIYHQKMIVESQAKSSGWQCSTYIQGGPN